MTWERFDTHVTVSLLCCVWTGTHDSSFIYFFIYYTITSYVRTYVFFVNNLSKRNSKKTCWHIVWAELCRVTTSLDSTFSLNIYNQLSPNSTCCVTSRRHDTTSTASCESWRDVMCRVVSCVLRRACSNMADDEEAVVLACTTISCVIIIIYYFSSQMQLIRLLKRITAIITLYTLRAKWRSSWRAL